MISNSVIIIIPRNAMKLDASVHSNNYFHSFCAITKIMLDIICAFQANFSQLLCFHDDS